MAVGGQWEAGQARSATGPPNWTLSSGNNSWWRPDGILSYPSTSVSTHFTQYTQDPAAFEGLFHAFTGGLSERTLPEPGGSQQQSAAGHGGKKKVVPVFLDTPSATTGHHWGPSHLYLLIWHQGMVP